MVVVRPTVMALKAMPAELTPAEPLLPAARHQMYVVVEGDVVEPGGGEGDGIWIMGPSSPLMLMTLTHPWEKRCW